MIHMPLELERHLRNRSVSGKKVNSREKSKYLNYFNHSLFQCEGRKLKVSLF